MPMTTQELWYDDAGNLVASDDPTRVVCAYAYGSEAPASAFPPGSWPPAPTLTSLNPATAASGDPPLTLSAIGTNFNSNCQIVFGNSVEVGVLVSDTELTTKVIPEFFAPATVPVYVQDNFGQQTAPLDFTFT
jgi:IPT/TIG domain-containing protein